jgi:hypothetical protein
MVIFAQALTIGELVSQLWKLGPRLNVMGLKRSRTRLIFQRTDVASLIEDGFLPQSVFHSLHGVLAFAIVFFRKSTLPKMGLLTTPGLCHFKTSFDRFGSTKVDEAPRFAKSFRCRPK